MPKTQLQLLSRTNNCFKTKFTALLYLMQAGPSEYKSRNLEANKFQLMKNRRDDSINKWENVVFANIYSSFSTIGHSKRWTSLITGRTFFHRPFFSQIFIKYAFQKADFFFFPCLAYSYFHLLEMVLLYHWTNKIDLWNQKWEVTLPLENLTYTGLEPTIPGMWVQRPWLLGHSFKADSHLISGHST